MDKELRDLERKALTDHDAALQLVSKLKKLTSSQWGVVLCSSCNGLGSHITGSSFNREKYCPRCGGEGAFRVDVSRLKELPSLALLDPPEENNDKATIVTAPFTENSSGETCTIIHVPSKGASFSADQELIELEFDKATVCLPAPISGVVKEVFVTAGQTVRTGTPLLSMVTYRQWESME